MKDMLSYHTGRSWDGPGHLEENCPCPKEPCGLVQGNKAVEECEQHHWRRAKTMRCGHREDTCPGVEDER